MFETREGMAVPRNRKYVFLKLVRMNGLFPLEGAARRVWFTWSIGRGSLRTNSEEIEERDLYCF